MIWLELTEDEALAVHHSLSTTVDLMDQVGERNIPDSAPLKGQRPNLVQVAKRLDHERRHQGAVPNPNGPELRSTSEVVLDVADLELKGSGDELRQVVDEFMLREGREPTQLRLTKTQRQRLAQGIFPKGIGRLTHFDGIELVDAKCESCRLGRTTEIGGIAVHLCDEAEPRWMYAGVCPCCGFLPSAAGAAE